MGPGSGAVQGLPLQAAWESCGDCDGASSAALEKVSAEQVHTVGMGAEQVRTVGTGSGPPFGPPPAQGTLCGPAPSVSVRKRGKTVPSVQKRTLGIKQLLTFQH